MNQERCASAKKGAPTYFSNKKNVIEYRIANALTIKDTNI